MEKSPTIRRRRSRGLLPWAVTLLLAVTPLAVASAGDAAGPDSRAGSAADVTAPAGTLKVRVVKPARKRVATVVVTGPDGFRKVVHRTTRLTGLEPGRYRVRARTVRTPGWYSKPEVTRAKVRLRAGRTARTTVSYWTVVSTRTTVLKAKDIRTYQSPAATPGSTGTIVLDEKVPVGTILAAGITPDTPAGALVEVVSTSKAGTGWSYVVRLSSVEKAVPRGEFGGTYSFAAPATRAARITSKAGGCQGEFKGGVEIDGDGTITAQLGAKWDWGSSYVYGKLSADAWVMAKAWAEARGACTTGDITLWNGDLAYVPIPIGPIVLVLVPHLDVSVNASVAAEGRLRVEAAAGIKAAAVAKVGLKGGSITGEGPTFDAWSNFDSYAAAVADAHATVRLSMLLYKLAGPYMQATVGLRGKATTTADPWWTVDAYAKAGAGVTVGGCLDLWIKKWCLRLDKSAPNLIDATYRIAQAAGARPPTYAVSNALAGPRTQIEGIVVSPEPTSWTIGKYVDVGEDLHLTTGTTAQLPGASGEVASQDRPGSETPNDLVHDPTTFTVTVIPEGNRLRIPWVFATEEPAGSGMDGATIEVAGTNCALVGGHPVSANDATTSNADQHLTTRYDRVTPIQLCDVPVVPHQPVTVELSVFDTWNGENDSVLAIVRDHISSYDG